MPQASRVVHNNPPPHRPHFLSNRPHSSRTLRRTLAQTPLLHRTGLLGLLLSDDFSRVEFHEHGAVGLDFLDGNGEAEVVEEEELQFEVVEFGEGEAADLWERGGWLARVGCGGWWVFVGGKGRTFAYRELV